jgi:hypothetical protein
MSFRLGLLDALNIELERTDELGSPFARAIGRCLESLKAVERLIMSGRTPADQGLFSALR